MNVDSINELSNYRTLYLMTRRPIAPWLPWVYGGVTMLLLVILTSVLIAPALDLRTIIIILLILVLLALTVVNVMLYNRVEAALKRRVMQLAALSEISKELYLTLSQEQVYKLVLDRACDAVNADSGSVVLYEGMDRPHIVARRNEIKLTTGVLLSIEAFREAVKLGVPVLDKKLHSSSPLKSRMLVPIMRDAAVVAVIVLDSRRHDAFSDDDLSFIKQLAAHASVVIENARMFEWFQESRNRLQVILDSLTEAVIVFGEDGRIALANPKVGDLLDLNPNLLIGENITRLLERADLELAEKIGFTADELTTLFSTKADHKHTDGAHYRYILSKSAQGAYIERTIAPVMNYTGHADGIVMVFSDVTEEQQAARTREDLTSMIVHDLRSPLTAMNASMKLLGEIGSRDESLNRTLQRTTDTSQRALRKMLNMVNSLLDIAKMESSGKLLLDRDFYPLTPIAEAVRNELLPLADELEIEIALDIPADLPALKIEGEKIERVLLNLVDNALKFSPLSSTITISARQANSEMVRVAVIDNGPGVPDDQKGSVFERFRQASGGIKGNRSGTGLGLTFCRVAILAHGGDIWVEDNPTGGSMFIFTLPAAVTVMHDEH
jgi:PAS domain S-box-containing protein